MSNLVRTSAELAVDVLNGKYGIPVQVACAAANYQPSDPTKSPDYLAAGSDLAGALNGLLDFMNVAKKAVVAIPTFSLKATVRILLTLMTGVMGATMYCNLVRE